MNRTVPMTPAAFSWRWLRLPSLLAVLAALSGCFQPHIRSQKEEETDKERYRVKTVGEVSTFGNAEPITVSGVGLVEGLEGTGSPAPAGELRQIIEHELRRAKEKDLKSLLSSRDTSIVLVATVVPAGAKRGDKLDLEITLPAGSRTTSLRGGYLRRCILYTHDYARNVSPQSRGGNATLRGNPLVRAEGPLLVGVGGGPEADSLRRGRISNGGLCAIDRQFHILLNSNNQLAAVAGNLANRVNAAFQDSVLMTPGSELASAKSNTVVTLNVPAQYRLNIPRFLRVVRMVPLEDSAPAAKDDKKTRLPYREQLAEDLLDPSRTVTAAIRLEALGKPALPAFREGLKHPHPLVRFCSAEALAYLGSPAAGEELARQVEQQPYLRAFALTAMASLDEAVCQVKLKELMASDLDDETRYGAFRALRTLDEKAPEVSGDLLNDTYTLHEVSPRSKPLVHFTTGRRAEIVLFGPPARLLPPLSILSGEYALTATEDAVQCTITHIPVHSGEGGETRKMCPLELNQAIRTLAAMGASYPEVIEVIRQADACKNVNCRVRCDALPQALPTEALVLAGKEKLGKESNGVLLIKPDTAFGATPTLYQKDAVRRKPLMEREREALEEKKSKEQSTE